MTFLIGAAKSLDAADNRSLLFQDGFSLLVLFQGDGSAAISVDLDFFNRSISALSS
jgi:hypothetical protein